MKNDKLYLQHNLECIDNIESYIPNGEATKSISIDLRAIYPVVPWREMAGMWGG